MISVIVPCYNQVDYLPRCLDSIIGQSYGNLEIVCVNDESTDATMGILKDYAQKDRRIKILDVPHGGLGWARNCGIGYATGDYLMFCDSDDEFMPDACEKLRTALTAEDCDTVLCSIKVIYDSDHQMKSSDANYYTLKFSGLIENCHQILNKTDLSVCNKIFRKSLVDKYNIKFIENRLYEDASFTWKYLAVSNRIYCIKDALYKYYRHDNSIMNKTFAKANRSIDHIYVADNVYEFLVQQNIFHDFIRDFFFFYKSYVKLAKRYKDENSSHEIENLDRLLQEKYDLWIKDMEKKNKLEERNRVLANLRSNVKLKK